MTPEIWRSIPSLPGVLASSRGRIMVVPYTATMPNGAIRQYGGYARKGSWDGARYIWRRDRFGKTYRVARMVCEAFNGPPPFDGAVCMHLDEDSRNNAPSNLEWGTQKENLNSPGFIQYCKARTGENNPLIKGRKAIAARAV